MLPVYSFFDLSPSESILCFVVNAGICSFMQMVDLSIPSCQRVLANMYTSYKAQSSLCLPIDGEYVHHCGV